MTHQILLQVAISGDALYKTAQLLADKAKGNCLSLAGIMLFVHFSYTLFRMLVFGEKLDVTNLMRVVALMFFIGSYNELMGLVVSAINELSNTYAKVDDILAKIKTVSGDSANNSSAWDMLTMDLGGALNFILTAIEHGLSMIIRLLLENVKQVLMAFIYSVGIFAAALSTVPGLGGTISHWFRAMLNILFWTLTLSVLDNLVVGLSTAISSNQGSDIVNMLVVNLALILMYIAVPVLTTIYIGYAATSSMMGAMNGLVGGAAGRVGYKIGSTATEKMGAWGSAIKDKFLGKNEDSTKRE